MGYDRAEAEIKRAALAEGVTVADAALRLADLKAMAVARREPEALVIGADHVATPQASTSDEETTAATGEEDPEWRNSPLRSHRTEMKLPGAVKGRAVVPAFAAPARGRSHDGATSACV